MLLRSCQGPAFLNFLTADLARYVMACFRAKEMGGGRGGGVAPFGGGGKFYTFPFEGLGKTSVQLEPFLKNIIYNDPLEKVLPEPLGLLS